MVVGGLTLLLENKEETLKFGTPMKRNEKNIDTS